MISKKKSLRNSKAVSFVFKNSKKLNTKYFLLRFVKNKFDAFKMAIIVRKKDFKKAVDRNYVKRVVSHIIHKNDIDKKDYLFIVTPKTTLSGVSFEEIEKDLIGNLPDFLKH